MTPEERVGQMFMPAISASGSNGSQVMTSDLARMIDTIHPGGVILLARDLADPKQVIQLTDALQNQSPVLKDGSRIPLFISIDQEGGYINRLPFGPRMPGNMALGASGKADLTRKVASAIGNELSSLGINMNFGPVLDVETNQNNPVIGIRSFGSNPKEVSRLGGAYIGGMHDAGIICTGKHFPGHGDVDVDSHVGLPLENHTKERMNEVELVPFVSAIGSGVDGIMTAHIIFPAYDNNTVTRKDGTKVPIPATLSKPILTGLLREDLSFNGLIITDAMMMKAIQDNYQTTDAAVMAVRAGADIILYPDPVEDAYAAVVAAYNTDPEIQAQVNASVERIIRVKQQYGILESKSSSVTNTRDLGSRLDHAQESCLGDDIFALEKEAAEQTVTLISDPGGIVPVNLSQHSRIVILSPSASFTQEISDGVNATTIIPTSEFFISAYTYTNQTNLSDEQRSAVMNSSLVLFGTVSTNATQRSATSATPVFSRDLLQVARESGSVVVGLALNQPYDIMYMPDIPVYFATYAGRTGGQNVKSAIRALFGEIPITGTLPVDIEDPLGSVMYPVGTGIILG
jgi:beta-N-acetylhexosaminidase